MKLTKFFLFGLLSCGLILSACGKGDLPSSTSTSSNSTNTQSSDNSDSSSNTPTVTMTDSYATARGHFKHITGIEVPALANLEADTDYFTFYKETDTEYCFDIVSGSALNFQTYMIFENFFSEKLGNCETGYPDGDETNGRDAQWIKDGRWFQTYWDAHNQAIYLNTTLRAN